MEAEGELNYEMELLKVRNNRTTNLNTLQRFLTSVEKDVALTCQKIRGKVLSLCEEKKKIKQKIEEVRRAIQEAEAGHTRGKEEVQELQRELERLNVQVQGKEEELKVQREALARCMEEMKEKESLASDMKVENQKKIGKAENSIQLFQKHLGLDIICMQSTLVLKFTQVNHSNPEKEYMVHLCLKEDKYVLLQSEPPLPCLPQLQEQLNASGNLLACIVQIRKLFQKME